MLGEHPATELHAPSLKCGLILFTRLLPFWKWICFNFLPRSRALQYIPFCKEPALESTPRNKTIALKDTNNLWLSLRQTASVVSGGSFLRTDKCIDLSTLAMVLLPLHLLPGKQIIWIAPQAAPTVDSRIQPWFSGLLHHRNNSVSEFKIYWLLFTSPRL